MGSAIEPGKILYKLLKYHVVMGFSKKTMKEARQIQKTREWGLEPR